MNSEMAELEKIVRLLDLELRTAEIADHPNACNGLQLQNSGHVGLIQTAVDASLAVVTKAAVNGGLLIVHHGMLWDGVRPITGPFYQKIKVAVEGDLAIYSNHLPLDFHPVLGNNALLAKAIGLKDVFPILLKNGFPEGVQGTWNGTVGTLEQAVSLAVDRKSTVCGNPRQQVETVAVITGGGGSQLSRIEAAGADVFVTGEGPHSSFVTAEDAGMNVIFAGHYATETFGVRAVGEFLSERLQIPHRFIGRPGGF